MFNKVILTYFTPLSSFGNSLTLLKRRNIDCKFIKIASINQVLGGSESVMRYVSTPFVTVLVKKCFWETGVQLVA